MGLLRSDGGSHHNLPPILAGRSSLGLKPELAATVQRPGIVVVSKVKGALFTVAHNKATWDLEHRVEA